MVNDSLANWNLEFRNWKLLSLAGNLVHVPVEGRIVNALLTLVDRFGINERGFIAILLTRQDLASFAGTSYETVFRILNEIIEDDCHFRINKFHK